MTRNDRVGASDLLVTVYLDTVLLVDLLAALEDGFTLVRHVTEGQTTTETAERRATAGAATPGILNLLGVGFSGSTGRSDARSSGEVAAGERTHTYGSLLHRLRGHLLDHGLVRGAPDSPSGEPSVGSFVEFAGVVRPNPFTDAFEKLRRMLQLGGMGLALETATQPRRGKQARQPRVPSAAAPPTPVNAMVELLEGLTEAVEREGTKTIVMNASDGTDYTGVLTLFDAYLRDRSMSELLNREFRVLGKIARHLPPGSQEGVDLLASSGLAGFPEEIVQELTSAAAEVLQPNADDHRHLATTIGPPAIEIVPIAVYL